MLNFGMENSFKTGDLQRRLYSSVPEIATSFYGMVCNVLVVSFFDLRLIEWDRVVHRFILDYAT